MRPLYLDAAVAWQVKLDDGPALHISATGRTRSLFPLNRLARVVSPCSAEWQSAALLACLRAGVPVLFNDPRGSTVGWCFGSRKRETTLATLLRLAIDEPEGARWIDDWRLACDRREMLAALREMGLRSLLGRASLEAADIRSRLCNLHRQRLGRAPGAWLGALERAVQALAAQQVYEQVGDPALIGHAAPGLHLGIVLAQVLQWRLHRLLHATPSAMLQQAPAARWAAQAIEVHAVSLHTAAGAALGLLEGHLRHHLG